MISMDEVRAITAGNGNVLTEDGTKIGGIAQVFLDDDTGQPEWVTTTTGLFGTAESFVPLAQARVTGDDIVVPYDKSKVKDAPRIEGSDGHLDRSQEAELYRHYGLPYSDAHSDSGLPTDTGQAATTTGSVGDDTSGPTTDQAMTRSEEELHVGTRSEEAGRVRLRKYVETEQVTQTVPVRKEKAVLEREPVNGDNVDQALAGPDISEEEHEVVLREERPVVEKETVPVERIRLDKEQVTEERTVTDEVRKERIETEGDIADRH